MDRTGIEQATISQPLTVWPTVWPDTCISFAGYKTCISIYIYGYIQYGHTRVLVSLDIKLYLLGAVLIFFCGSENVEMSVRVNYCTGMLVALHYVAMTVFV